MVDEVTSYIIENEEAFKRGIDRLASQTDNYKVPFSLIRNDFHRSSRKIFTLRSKGLYPPLGGISPTKKKRKAAELRKKKRLGFAYPVLVGETRKLMKSLITRNSEGSESFVGRKILLLGTSIEYAKYHQSDRDRSKIPQRKVVFIDGGPAEKSQDASISGRRERWLNIMNDYLLKLINQELF